MIQLRDYQKKAIEKIRMSFQKGHKRVLLVAPTGSGKTVVACSMIQQAMAKNSQVLFVAHRRELVKQCSKKLSEFGVDHGIIMALQSPNSYANTQISSIQTFTRRKDREGFIKPRANLIIIDEAHRSTSKSFQALINEYPEAYVIGLTATPCRTDGSGLGNIYDDLIECENIKTLTRQGFLVPSKIVAPTLPDLKGIKTVGGDYEKKSLSQKMDQPKLIGDIVMHWEKFADNRPTVVFATSIAHSKHIRNIFLNSNISAGHIDGEMDELEREEQLDLLHQGKIKVLCNCQVLTEGWDEPKVSCVILARPTKSYGLYLQMVGRSLRIYPGKKDTLIIDHAGCVYEMGFPDDEPNWALSKSVIKEPKEKEQQPIEKQPLTCLNCYHVYFPEKDFPSCPECEWTPTKQEKVLLIKQGRLVELPKTKPLPQDKENFYAQLLYYAKQKNYKIGWCSWIFKEKFGHFPYSKKVLPICTSADVLKYIQYINIRRSKSKYGGQNV
jgi:DNA repair protein RadD